MATHQGTIDRPAPRVEIPAALDQIEPLLAFLRTLATRAGFDDEGVEALALATTEAAHNTIVHGLERNDRETISVTFHVTSSGLTISLRDRGIPFDPERARRAREEAGAARTEDRDRGMDRMRRSVDEVTFVNHGRGGREIRLVKYLPAKRVDRMSLPGEMVRFDPTGVPPPEDRMPASWQVHDLRPDEALEVSRCAYRAYGYTYPDYIYYPERIVEMNRAGLLHSAAAVDEQGEMLGHLALEFEEVGATVAELGVAFVKPRYRRLGVFQTLWDHLRAMAGQRGLLGLFGQAVTTHEASQRAVQRWGFGWCGLLLGALPPDLDFKALGGSTPQRESAALCWFALRDLPRRRVHLPARHAELLQEIFDKLAIPVATTGPLGLLRHPADTRTRTTTRVRCTHGVASIDVDATGEHVYDHVKRQLRRLCRDRTDVVHLRLDLESPRAPELSDRFESLGFFPAGILPFGLHGRHALLLQYLNNVRIDPSRICLAAEDAQRFLAYLFRIAPSNQGLSASLAGGERASQH